MKKPNLKRLSPFIVALITFLAIGIIYCSPVLEGRVLQAGDTTNYLGASNEIRQYSKSDVVDQLHVRRYAFLSDQRPDSRKQTEGKA